MPSRSSDGCSAPSWAPDLSAFSWPQCGLLARRPAGEGHQNFDNDGWLTIGLNGRQAEIAENDINTGSLYGCCAIFLPLGLSFNDSFWVGPFEEWTTLKAWNGNLVEPDQSIDF